MWWLIENIGQHFGVHSPWQFMLLPSLKNFLAASPTSWGLVGSSMTYPIVVWLATFPLTCKIIKTARFVKFFATGMIHISECFVSVRTDVAVQWMTYKRVVFYSLYSRSKKVNGQSNPWIYKVNFHTNKNSLYLLRNRGKEIVLPTSCTSYGHLACMRVSYRSRQGTRPCQRLPLWSERKHITCARSNDKEKDFGELQHVSVLCFYLVGQSRSLFYNSCWHEKINVNTQFMTSTIWTMVWSPN